MELSWSASSTPGTRRPSSPDTPSVRRMASGGLTDIQQYKTVTRRRIATRVSMGSAGSTASRASTRWSAVTAYPSSPATSAQVCLLLPSHILPYRTSGGRALRRGHLLLPDAFPHRLHRDHLLCQEEDRIRGQVQADEVRAADHSLQPPPVQGSAVPRGISPL